MAYLSHLNPFMSYIADEKTDEKLKELFEFYDIDGNGVIQRQELIEVLSLCAHEIGLDVKPFLEQIADAVFSNANLNQSGSITFEALKEVLRSRPNLTSELSLAKAIESPEKNRDKKPSFHKARWEYIRNNLTRFNFFLGIVLFSVALIIARIITYWNHGGASLIAARCAGQCLNFLSSAIVLLVCRRSISLLRARGWSRYLPLDDHVYFHKMLGLMVVGHSIVHTIGHMVNFYNLSQAPGAQFTYAQFLFTTKPGIGWIGSCASITGWILLLIIGFMSLAHPFARSLGKFELFYYTHLLYIPYWLLLFLHAPRFWIWFLVPFAIFMSETFFRLKNLLTDSGQTTIVKAVPLPSNVIHLVIKKPPNFEFQPGDWIYVLIPQIAKYEWHPFTISSAPEQEGNVIWLHIRAVGEWTRSLRSYFENTGQHRNLLCNFIKNGQFSMSMDQFAAPPPNLTSMKIFIDGPYGSPSSQIFRAEHAVLIATGIGVTPFASILQSIVHHHGKRRQKCPNCQHEFSDTRPPIFCKLRKVDFVWINRDQKSFEWFIKLLAELEFAQSHLPPGERFLDIHIHLTAMEPAKTKSIGLQLALYLMHETNKKDLITGLRTRTRAGRPNWDEFFTQIQEQKKGKVSVFFCGRPQLGRLLHRQCDSFNFKFRKEIF